MHNLLAHVKINRNYFLSLSKNKPKSLNIKFLTLSTPTNFHLTEIFCDITSMKKSIFRKTKRKKLKKTDWFDSFTMPDLSGLYKSVNRIAKDARLVVNFDDSMKGH
jgi:hypothetical protein